MAKFCTQCGAPNPDTHSFCEGCGQPMRPAVGANAAGAGAQEAVPSGAAHGATQEPLVPGATSQPAERVRGPGLSRRAVRWTLAGVGSGTVLAAGGLYLVLAGPSASVQNLREAAQRSLVATQVQEMNDSLCLSNIGYEGPSISINPSDERTRSWMETLVAAGLYGPATEVTVGSYFYSQRLRYEALPELETWRVGRKLCVAKGVAVTDVVDVQAPKKMPVSDRDNAPTIAVVVAKVVYQPADVAPWLAKPEVQAAVPARLSSWKLVDGTVRRTVSRRFAYHEGQWITGRELETLATAMVQAWRAEEGHTSSRAKTRAAATGGGFMDPLMQMFSTDAHPLVGTWRPHGNDKATQRMLEEADESDLNLTFTNTSATFQGQVYASRFEVDGNEVAVSMDDGPEMTVRVHDKHTISVSTGFGRLQFRRQ